MELCKKTCTYTNGGHSHSLYLTRCDRLFIIWVLLRGLYRKREHLYVGDAHDDGSLTWCPDRSALE